MKSIVDHIKQGGIIAYPTETIWGLGADIANEVAVEKIFKLKQRSESKAISVLVRDIPQAKTLAEIDEKTEKLMQVYWPGPLTIVVPCKENVCERIHGGTEFVGLRQSSHPWIREFFMHFDGPITTTSINKSGEPPAKIKTDLDWLPKDIVVVDYETPAAESNGSTVIRVDEGELHILREGAITFAELNNFWNHC